MAIHERLPRANPQGSQTARLDEGEGVGESGACGGSEIRLCTLGAQSEHDAQGRIQAGVNHYLTGKETEPSELLYFKVYKSQIGVIEKALETAGLMLGSDKSRGYCLEMICADFLAGAHLVEGSPSTLLMSLCRLIEFLPEPMKAELQQRIAVAS